MKFSDYLIKAKNASSIEERELNIVNAISLIQERIDMCNLSIRSICIDLYFVSVYDDCTIVYMLEKANSLRKCLEKMRSLQNRLLSLKRFLSVGFNISLLRPEEISFLEGNEDEGFI